MDEKQYNSKLIKDKLSQIPVAANDLLWANLEAQLVAIPETQLQNSQSKTGAAKSSSVKLAATLLTIVTVVAVLLIVFLKPTKYPVTPVTFPSKPATTIKKVDSVKADTLLNELEKTRKSKTSVAKEEVNIKSTLPVVDTSEIKKLTDPLPVAAEKEHLHLKSDSIKSIAPPPLQTNLIVDTGKTRSPKKEEGYYFDVQKRKKTKNN